MELTVAQSVPYLFIVKCFYDKSFFTIAEIAFPSALPASCLVATPITLPISWGVVAPTSAIMPFTASVSSSSLICLGRYFSSTATCASSSCARSVRFWLSQSAADSRPCFASLPIIFIAVALSTLSPAPGACKFNRRICRG